MAVKKGGLMPQVCKVCIHPQREAIDAELLSVEGRSYRAIGSAFSVGKDSLARHYSNHLPLAAREQRAEELTTAKRQAEERYARLLASIRLDISPERLTFVEGDGQADEARQVATPEKDDEARQEAEAPEVFADFVAKKEADYAATMAALEAFLERRRGG